MKTIKNRICIIFITSTLFSASPVCGETNSIDFSAFYREWKTSPSNALEKITPPLMALAASAKTNAADKACLESSLWNLVSTNALVRGDDFLQDKKYALIVDAFKSSGDFSTPQEDEILSLAKTLALIRKSFKSYIPEAEAGKYFRDNASLNFDLGENFEGTIMNFEVLKYLVPFDSLRHESNLADGHIRRLMSDATWRTENVAQQIRDNTFIKVISMQIFTPQEEGWIGRLLEPSPAAIQAHSNSNE